MILEFKEHQYVDVDKITALRWLDMKGFQGGIIVIGNEKIVVTEREEFDVIEAAFIYLHKSHMVDDEMKKMRFVRRGKDAE